MRVLVEVGKRFVHIETGPISAIEPEPLTVTEDEEPEGEYVVLPIGFQAPPEDEREPEW